MSSDNEITENLAKGATKGVLEWTEEKVKELVRAFKNRNVAFIKDKESINLIKEQSKNNELLLFKNYIEDKDYLILFKLGLVLRKVQNNSKKLDSIKEKIKLKYKSEGLYIAYFIQNGLFSKYVINIIDNNYISVNNLKQEIEFLFKNIKKIVSFIHNEDIIDKKSREIITIIDANKPYCFILSAMGNATKIANKIKTKVEKQVNNYEVEINSTKNKVIYFFNSNEIM